MDEITSQQPEEEAVKPFAGGLLLSVDPLNTVVSRDTRNLTSDGGGTGRSDNNDSPRI